MAKLLAMPVAAGRVYAEFRKPQLYRLQTS